MVSWEQRHFITCFPWRTISDVPSWCSLVKVVQNCHWTPSSQPEHISWIVCEIKNHPTKDNRHRMFKRITSNSSESIFFLNAQSEFYHFRYVYWALSVCMHKGNPGLPMHRDVQVCTDVSCLSRELFTVPDSTVRADGATCWLLWGSVRPCLSSLKFFFSFRKVRTKDLLYDLFLFS